MGRGTLEEVRDGSGYPREGPGRFGVHSERSRTGRGTLGDYWTSRKTLGEVQEWLGVLCRTSGEVRDESREPRGGP